MPEATRVEKLRIDAHTAQMRWEQGRALTLLFSDIWKCNPLLAAKAGCRVQEFMMPLAEVPRRHGRDLS